MKDINFDIPSFDEIEISENNSIEIGKKLAAQLRKKCGVIQVSFAKKNNKYLNNIIKSVSAMSIVLDSYSDVSTKTDINSLYENSNYVFALYNDVYRFTVFVMEHKMNYPINVTVDEDISKEIGYKEHNVVVKSDDDYIELLTKIVNSPKMIAVIKAMNAKTTED